MGVLYVWYSTVNCVTYVKVSYDHFRRGLKFGLNKQPPKPIDSALISESDKNRGKKCVSVGGGNIWSQSRRAEPRAQSAGRFRSGPDLLRKLLRWFTKMTRIKDDKRNELLQQY